MRSAGAEGYRTRSGLEDHRLSPSTGLRGTTADQLGLVGLEERLERGVIVAAI